MACFVFSAWCNFAFARQIEAPEFLSTLPAIAQEWIGNSGHPLSEGERSDLLLAVTAPGTAAIGIGCFFGSALFHRRSSREHQSRVERMFAKLRTPVKAAPDAHLSDKPVYRLLGRPCTVYGAFVLLLVLIPNGIVGRLCFVFVGGVIGGAGVVLHRIARRKARLAQGTTEAHVPAAVTR